MRQTIAATLMSLAICIPALADENVLTLWPEKAPGEQEKMPAERAETKDNITRIFDVSAPSLTVMRPAEDKDTGAAVLVFPGGGYHILAWDLEGTEVGEWLNKIGVTAVIVKYRVPARKDRERHAPPLQDVQRAVGVVREHAAEWKLDPKKIGVLGFSAGGHLAATLSNNFEQRSYEPIDAADKQSCRPDFCVLIYPAYLVDGKTDAVVPELKVTEQTPPTFIAITADDPVRVEGPLFYYLALKNAKVPAEMHVYPIGGHGYGLRPSKNTVSMWPERVEQWMRAGGIVE